MPHRYRVLVVEDDGDMREIERQVLGYAGFEVLLAANGREALDRVTDQACDVILLDLMMPVMDGLTFLTERSRLGLATGVPIVCVSAGGAEMLRHALRLGAAECLQKPVDLDELCERVEQRVSPEPLASSESAREVVEGDSACRPESPTYRQDETATTSSCCAVEPESTDPPPAGALCHAANEAPAPAPVRSDANFLILLCF